MTIHIQGYGKDIDLLRTLSSDYRLGLSFPFGEKGDDIVDNIFFRFYESKEECTLEDAVKGFSENLFGRLHASGEEYGYSEYTVEGFTISELRLGGHDLQKILESKNDKYLHILIDKISL